ncbi:hypothetical protein ACFL6Q_03670 [Candidatus Neomarinimicrobiota bacterium]
MNHSGFTLFSTVPSTDPFSFYESGEIRYKDVINALNFRAKDVSLATGIPQQSVRYDDRIPGVLKVRIREWATLLTLVAEHFDGDGEKTYQWFTLPNPLLGNVSPRDMIRAGNYENLYKYVMNALSGNLP